MRDNLTPAMSQYLAIKEKYKDCLLLYRMGDFYEMFFEDAIEASKVLDLTLTSRNKEDENPIPMAGFPAHALMPYLTKLIENRKKVAICEQVEDPRYAKGIVRREVVQVVTPGVRLDADLLISHQNNNLAAVFPGEKGIGIAVLDASTGQFRATYSESAAIAGLELARIEPREILVPDSGKETSFIRDFSWVSIQKLPEEKFSAVAEGDSIAEGGNPECALCMKRCVNAVKEYLGETQKELLPTLKEVEYYEISNFMLLDENTLRNLEITQTILTREKKGSLFNLINLTKTPMGARELRERLIRPLLDPSLINERLDQVEWFAIRGIERRECREILVEIADMERLLSRLAAGIGNARDMLSLAKSLGSSVRLLDFLKSTDGIVVNYDIDTLQLEELSAKIVETLRENPPQIVTEGGMIREGVNQQLDELISLARNGKEWFVRYEASERDRTQIPNLKVRYNKVFGYHIEVTKSYLSRVPSDYIRKQTMVNAERFFTEDLKKYEDLVLNAEEKRAALEREIFEELRVEILSHIREIQRISSLVAKIDVHSSLAEVAITFNFKRPTLTFDRRIKIIDGRHPVVEAALQGTRFIPNGVEIDGDKTEILIITGPNMAGKSTVMRQVALIVILAQMGSFVPAKSAEIGIVDRIFTRIGAMDELAAGRSTFMVEMMETAEIIKNASRQSLILLDEVGRGTSTFDGLSIAWAVVEYIASKIHARTLFATHYHELTELGRLIPVVKNCQIAVKEWNGEVIFLRKLVDGSVSRSYGIQVARIAGLPEPLIKRAKEVLKWLEEHQSQLKISDSVEKEFHIKAAKRAEQLDMFAPPEGIPENLKEIAERLKGIELDVLTPIEALNLLHEIKKKL